LASARLSSCERHLLALYQLGMSAVKHVSPGQPYGVEVSGEHAVNSYGEEASTSAHLSQKSTHASNALGDGAFPRSGLSTLLRESASLVIYTKGIENKTFSLLLIDLYIIDNVDPWGTFGVADKARPRGALGGAIVCVKHLHHAWSAWEGVSWCGPSTMRKPHRMVPC